MLRNNHRYFRQSLLTIAASMLLAVSASAQFVPDGYTVTCAGAGNNGGWMLQVTAVGKTIQQAQQQVPKNAVHGVLFDGFGGTVAGCVTQRPIIADKNVVETHRSYFEELFAGQVPSQYVTVVNTQAAPPVKTKEGFRVTALTSVDTDGLRCKLEQDGVIRGLSSNFQPPKQTTP